MNLEGAQIIVQPLDGGPWQNIGTVVPGSIERTETEEFQSVTFNTQIRDSFSIDFTIKKAANRKVLRMYLGDRLPRSARSLRRRRSKLRRKRMARRRNR